MKTLKNNQTTKQLIILHGWQSSKEKWQKVKEILEKEGIRVIVPDIPGFKPETRLNKTWNLDDYVEWFKDFLFKKRTTYPELREGTCPELREGFFLLGHSFGGRLAIKFATKYPQKINGLILVSAAGIKRNSFSKEFLGLGAEIAKDLKIEEVPVIKDFWQLFKKFFYRYILRKTDYLEAKGALKETIKNVLDEDLTPLLNKISVPTLILWGRKDRITPLKDALLMKEKIKNSKLKILEEIGHNIYLENPELLAKIISHFILKFAKL